VAVAQAVPAPVGVAVMASKPVPVVKKTVSTPLIGISAARPAGVRGPVSPAPSTPAPTAPETPAEPVLVSAPPATPAPAPAAEPEAKTKLVANFENGLDGWSTAPAGNIPPRVVRGVVRDGANASAVRLTGEQSRSLLAFGGEGGSGDAVQIHEGDEYTFAFSFYIQSMSYGEPGADNVILQFMSDASDTRTLGLQLWQDGIADPLNSGRGLWASGDAMGGDRFLAPLAERTWHDVMIRFRASSQGDGFYILSLDGELLDARGEISLIAPGSSSAQIEVGLLRDSTVVQGTSEIRLDAASLESAEG
jgi:Polysaccharide lyase